MSSLLSLPRRIASRAFGLGRANMHLYAQEPDGRAGRGGPLTEIFYAPKERLVHKWLHYLDIYERHFSRYRGEEFRFLEIGVGSGGSLEVWLKYFGPQATIYGVDINPDCAGFAPKGTHVRIGSQADPEFLASVIEEMGAPDVILDDGSHVAKHQEITFRHLFPKLKDGGLYVIEDLHTAYWTGWGGGFGRKGSAIEMIKSMIDDMHAWYHQRSESYVPKDEVGSLHVYDSIVVIEKRRRGPPAHVQVPPAGANSGLSETP